MSYRDKGVHPFERFFCDVSLHEGVSVFSDRMSEICSQREEEADRVDWTGRKTYELSVCARLMTQLKDFLEGARRSDQKIRQQVRTIRCYLSGSVNG